jgi:hypothetical protein
MKNIAKLSEEYEAKIKACKTYEELEAFFATAKSELAGNPDIKHAKVMNNEDLTDGLAQIYLEWYNEGWPSVE